MATNKSESLEDQVAMMQHTLDKDAEDATFLLKIVNFKMPYFLIRLPRHVREIVKKIISLEVQIIIVHYEKMEERDVRVYMTIPSLFNPETYQCILFDSKYAMGFVRKASFADKRMIVELRSSPVTECKYLNIVNVKTQKTLCSITLHSWINTTFTSLEEDGGKQSELLANHLSETRDMNLFLSLDCGMSCILDETFNLGSINSNTKSIISYTRGRLVAEDMLILKVSESETRTMDESAFMLCNRKAMETLQPTVTEYLVHGIWRSTQQHKLRVTNSTLKLE